MDILLIILGIIALIIGLLGCIIPMLPGPPLSYIALLLLHVTDRAQFSTGELVFCAILVVATLLLDYITPMLGTKYSGAGRWANWGSLIGTIVGLFFMPVGLIAGPFIGAFIGATRDGNTRAQALKAGIGSLIGFLFGTVLKFMACGYFTYLFIKALV